jgi:trans-aconitate methyltransferase
MNRWIDPEAYEAYVGRWSRVTAAEFLAWLHVWRGARWLDVGCGTGEVTRTILGRDAPESVHGVDPSELYIN